MDSLFNRSLKLHEEHKGKLEIRSKVLIKTKDDLSLAYTPGVAEVCREIAKNPSSVRRYTIKHNTIAVVSDGSAVLGLGNIGPEAALPVMEGKAILFKEFAGIDAFPLCLATQDPDEIIKTVRNIAPAFGGINLEDISAPRCFEIEKSLQETLSIPVMHDDQHGTTVVVLAGLINALKLKGGDKQKTKIVINGAGSAGTAVTELLHLYGFEHMLVCDSKGIISRDREDIHGEKLSIARKTNPSNIRGTLADAIKEAEVFIGVSKGGVLSAKLVQSMNPDPVIFAMANPIPEIMPDEAKKAGAFIVATGRSDFPNQVNNVLAFPGIFRGALDHRIVQFTNQMFLQAAQNLAALVTTPTTEQILPDPFDSEVVKAVSQAIRV